MVRRNYARGDDFPNEAFVQKAVERHFQGLGFDLDLMTHTDLICRHPQTGEEWHLEVKGMTKEIGLDFRTGLGQLVQRMTKPHWKYGLAMPDISGFRTQSRLLPQWVRETLSIHLLFVASDGTVDIQPPSAPVQGDPG